MLNRRHRLTLGLLLISATLVGCASNAKPGDPQTPPGAAGAGRPGGTVPWTPERPGALRPWEDPKSPLYERTIYFDYDRAEIKPEYVNLLRTHARYLGEHPELAVTLEGHADERGTREYNLALGDRRAESVRQFMLAEGVRSNQLSTLSYGEERPAVVGHNEEAWRWNRRVVIQY